MKLPHEACEKLKKQLCYYYENAFEYSSDEDFENRFVRPFLTTLLDYARPQAEQMIKDDAKKRAEAAKKQVIESPCPA